MRNLKILRRKIRYYYWKLKKPLSFIARKLQISKSYVIYLMKKLDIKIRTIQEAIKLLNRKGKNNPMFGLKGKNHPAYKHGGIAYCIDCGKEIISSHPHKRCVKCGGIQRGLKLKGRKRPEHSKLMSGKGNPAYINGLSNLPYTLEFSDDLKLRIRIRDNFECQLCHKSEEQEIIELHRVLTCHHIDYNKKNCSEINLLSLCHKCNIKVNLNRDYWFAYFTYIMENR